MTRYRANWVWDGRVAVKARSETLLERRMFRRARHRCVVPVTALYERATVPRGRLHGSLTGLALGLRLWGMTSVAWQSGEIKVLDIR